MYIYAILVIFTSLIPFVGVWQLIKLNNTRINTVTPHYGHRRRENLECCIDVYHPWPLITDRCKIGSTPAYTCLLCKFTLKWLSPTLAKIAVVTHLWTVTMTEFSVYIYCLANSNFLSTFRNSTLKTCLHNRKVVYDRLSCVWSKKIVLDM